MSLAQLKIQATQLSIEYVNAPITGYFLIIVTIQGKCHLSEMCPGCGLLIVSLENFIIDHQLIRLIPAD